LCPGTPKQGSGLGALLPFSYRHQTRGAWPCHFTLKSIFEGKKEEEELLWKLKYFTMQKYNLQKNNPLKQKKRKKERRPKSFKIL
jgi:hypothetical protein